MPTSVGAALCGRPALLFKPGVVLVQMTESSDREFRIRRSLRLPEFDYSQDGAYFVTICSHDRLPLFGQMFGERVVLSEAGHMLWQWWAEIENKFTSVIVGSFVVMPDHVHGICLLAGAPLRWHPQSRIGGRPHRAAPTIGNVMRWFKTMTTNPYIRGVNEHGWPRFQGSLWQRDFYEHVIRNEQDLLDTREYILNNPLRSSMKEDAIQ